METLTRWMAPAVLASGFGMGAMAVPQQAQAQDLSRVLVDVADVILRGGQPYYRHGSYSQNDRLSVQRDRYGRPIYYRTVDRSGPPYGNAYGYYRNGPGSRNNVKCNKKGKCKATYYDPRHDRDGYNDRYRRDDRYGYYRDDRRYRDRYDD